MADNEPPEPTEVGEPEAPVALDIDAPASPPEQQPLPHIQEAARRRLAYYLVSILALEVVVSVAFIWCHPDHIDTIRSWMTIVFGPTVALVGSAAGFYFGSAKSE
ncbi:MAG: hypothetical protein WA709_16745 [Stellaceae bacterium]